jgi:hypothetical protein
VTIYVNHGDGEGEHPVTSLETARGEVAAIRVNHGDGEGERLVWSIEGRRGLESAYDAQALERYADGDRMPAWTDTWCTHDFIQPADDRQPTYQADGIGGNPAVAFGGQEYFDPVTFAEPLAQPYTYYVVLDFDGGSGRSYPYYGAGVDGDRAFVDLDDGGNYEMWAGSGGAFAFPQTTGPVVLACVFDGPDSVFRIDDVERTGDPGSMAQRGHQLSNGRYPMRGSIGECRLYERAHDAATRDAIVG